MSIREILAEMASREKDQKAEVPVEGTAPTEEVSSEPSAVAKRKADSSGETPCHGEAPREEMSSTDVDAPDMEDEKVEKSEVSTSEPSMKVEEKEEEKEDEELEEELEESSCGKMEKEDEEEEVEESSCGSMKKEGYKKKMAESAEFSLSDELGSLLEAEGLNEEFRGKATAIFEAAVNSAAEKHLAKLDEQFDVVVEEAVREHTAKLDEQCEKYMDYVVEQWVAENEMAIQANARNVVAESFMTGLKDLLEAHYVELPEGKEDMYESAVAKQAELEAALEERVEEAMAVKAALKEAEKEIAVTAFVSEMTVVEAEKIRSLAEGIEFEGVEAFGEKLGMIKENYFPESSTGDADMIVEDAEGDAATEELTESVKVEPEMAKYLSALGKFK